MEGGVQQSSGGTYYDHHETKFPNPHRGDSVDVAMPRWLHAGVQHLASPAKSHSADPSVLLNILPRVYLLIFFSTKFPYSV
jgi:hypothetical protein